MNSATATKATETKTIHTLIEALNAKAEAAGCEVRAEWLSVDNSWGDLVGVALVGGDAAQQERAAQFAEKYFRAHIASQRCLSAQYAWDDRGVMELARFSRFDKATRRWVEGEGKLVRNFRPDDKCPRVNARVIAMAYFPGAD